MTTLKKPDKDEKKTLNTLKNVPELKNYFLEMIDIAQDPIGDYFKPDLPHSMSFSRREAIC